MSNDFTATIRQDSERAGAWREVFGSTTVPIRSPFPQWGTSPGVVIGQFYMIDLAAMTPEQRARMIQHIARTFHIPEAEVDAELDEVGCPILADDVTVTVFNPQKWI